MEDGIEPRSYFVKGRTHIWIEGAAILDQGFQVGAAHRFVQVFARDDIPSEELFAKVFHQSVVFGFVIVFGVAVSLGAFPSRSFAIRATFPPLQREVAEDLVVFL